VVFLCDAYSYVYLCFKATHGFVSKAHAEYWPYASVMYVHEVVYEFKRVVMSIGYGLCIVFASFQEMCVGEGLFALFA